MHLHLLVPGLIWPSIHARGFAHTLTLPALSRLLGVGRHRAEPAETPEQTWARFFNTDTATLADAPLRRWGEADALRVDTPLLCADPSHLHFAGSHLLLTDAGELAITRDEADALIDALNAEFADIGRFEAPTPDRWYLHPKQPPTAQLSRLSATTGRPIVHYLPSNGDALVWQRTMNEIQVVLHNHPINRAREAAGQRAINSVWFWGAGRLPASLTPPAQHIAASSPLVRGMARAAGCEPTRPDTFADLPAGDALVELPDAYHASLYLDLDPWQAAVLDLEQHWFAPALAALKAGTLKTLTLTLPDERGGRQITLSKRHLWCFWRKPQSLETFTLANYS
ncbi:hypothetical protein [Denitromonas ohlonensis]|uniref:Phosphoglycerate mutase n=2 Tax=Denitromonas TaxID=139331 RepID=A0A557REP6_9RHOO|nr:hypothetical protein [Denitromonas ohlonensis]TVO63641.1 hypothetical protein FHP90_14280 [Denitromonas ohlonensis]TVO74175.1 hypothetical protein FHP89_16260 [Denitromonas ohlonensis]